MEEIGNHHLDKAVELVKAGGSFVLVVDNSDWEIRAHDVRKIHQNRSVHAVAASLVFDRVSSTHLPNVAPQQDLAVINNDTLSFQLWMKLLKPESDTSSLPQKSSQNIYQHFSFSRSLYLNIFPIGMNMK